MPRSYDEYRDALEELSARCKRRGLPRAIWEKPLEALAAVRRLELEEEGTPDARA